MGERATPGIEIVRSTRRRTMCIEVHPGGSVVVRVPARATDGAVASFIESKRGWLDRTVERLRDMPAPPRWSFESLERIPYLGHHLTLSVRESPSSRGTAAREGEALVVTISPGLSGERERAAVRRLVRAWYAEEARRTLAHRVAHYSAIVGAAPARLRVGDQRRRWGSCSQKGSVSLNWRLLMAPPPALDYVVVHELCHLLHMDHSEAFWRCVAEASPDYRRWREWLRANGAGMEL